MSTISEQEKLDIEVMKAKQIAMKISKMDLMIFMVSNGVEFTGYKSIESALVSIVEDYKKENQVLINTHLKQYPD